MEMKRKKLNSWLAALMAAVMLLCLVPGKAYASGSCGNELSWSIEGDTLVITGKGKMTNYNDPEDIPWFEMRNDIRQISFPDGLTHVGELAFYDMKSLEMIVLPDSVVSVGDYTFSECSAVQMITLSGKLESIGIASFAGCGLVRKIDFPNSLKSIGDRAFSRCKSLTTVQLPYSVEKLGTSVFSYCENLASAQIDCNLKTLPGWTFYGCECLVNVGMSSSITSVDDYAFRKCDSLNTVYVGGTATDPDSLKEQIGEDMESFVGTGSVTNGSVPNTTITGKTEVTENNTLIETNTTVTTGQNSSVDIKVEHITPENGDDEYRTTVDIIIDNEDGWQEALDKTQDALEDLNDRTAQKREENIIINVQIKDGAGVDSSFADAFVGRDVELSFHAADGSKWSIDCSVMMRDEVIGAADLRYEISPASQEVCDALGVGFAYQLKFLSSADVDTVVKIRLPDAKGFERGTFFYKDKQDYVNMQTVVIDTSGYAQFYIASTDSEKEYVIALNVAGTEEQAIVPENMYYAYGGAPEMQQPIEYIITGRKSSWGMDIKQVTFILMGVMVGCAIIIGIVLYVLNKRKLKRGYVPDMIYEDEE